MDVVHGLLYYVYNCDGTDEQQEENDERRLAEPKDFVLLHHRLGPFW